MTPVHLFNVVSQHNGWLSVRQSAIAGNVANANTPGYKAQDVAPFEAAVEQARLAMSATEPGHLTPPAGGAQAPAARAEPAWEVTHSGNNVNLEQELIKAGEVNRAFRLNNGIVKAFHRMILASAKA
jgi:flagellar basal-body rod protein FlgB